MYLQHTWDELAVTHDTTVSTASLKKNTAKPYSLEPYFDEWSQSGVTTILIFMSLNNESTIYQYILSTASKHDY